MRPGSVACGKPLFCSDIVKIFVMRNVRRSAVFFWQAGDEFLEITNRNRAAAPDGTAVFGVSTESV